MARRFFALMLCLVIFLLPGCWDIKNIEDLSIIIAIGIDKSRDDQDLIQLTTTNPAFSDDSTAPVIRKTVQGFSINQALINMQRQRQRTIVLNKLRIIAFSEPIASGNTMHETLRQLEQRLDMDPNAKLVIIKGSSAQALLNLEPPEESLIGIYLDNLLEAAKNNGQIPELTVHHYWRQVNTRGVFPVIPVLEITEVKNGVVITGLAIIDEEGKMVGQLTDTEVLYYMLMTGTLRRGRFSTKVDYVRQRQRLISGQIKKYQTSIKTGIKDGHPVIDIKLAVEVDSIDVDMTLKNHLREEVFSGLETSLAENFQGELMKVIEKTQGLGADIFGLGSQVRIQHAQWFKGRDWTEDYRECKINLEVKVIIQRVGSLVNPNY